jgi:alpha-tubulin suppressor-like RCC1 family protein
VSAIALGANHTCALLGSGAVRCWGRNNFGKLGDGTPTNRYTPVSVIGITDASAIALGVLHTCAALRDSGAVRCWGDNNVGQLGDGSTTARHTPVEVLVAP